MSAIQLLNRLSIAEHTLRNMYRYMYHVPGGVSYQLPSLLKTYIHTYMYRLYTKQSSLPLFMFGGTFSERTGYTANGVEH